jgi:hypothetical protein
MTIQNGFKWLMAAPNSERAYGRCCTFVCYRRNNTKWAKLSSEHIPKATKVTSLESGKSWQRAEKDYREKTQRRSSAYLSLQTIEWK